MVCLSCKIQYRQQSEGSFMPDTDLQTSETSVMPSEADDIPNDAPVILNETSVIPSEALVILSEAKDLSPLGTPTLEDLLGQVRALEGKLSFKDLLLIAIGGA